VKQNMKSLGWGFLALLTCPCHLVLILPLLAGTTLGVYFDAHQTAVSVILGIVFVVSILMIFKKVRGKTNSSHDCCSDPHRKRGE